MLGDRVSPGKIRKFFLSGIVNQRLVIGPCFRYNGNIDTYGQQRHWRARVVIFMEILLLWVLSVWTGQC